MTRLEELDPLSGGIEKIFAQISAIDVGPRQRLDAGHHNERSE
jgi:hypothetical protein